MATKILSWDVGIKNLAYCIISKQLDKFLIEKWEKIDIVDSDKCVCAGLMKSGKVCGKKATYCFNDIYYCKLHKDEKVPDFKDIEAKFIDSYGNKCGYLNKSNKGKMYKYRIINKLLRST